jgi:hypothetical protein
MTVAAICIKIGLAQNYVQMPVENAIWSEYYLVYDNIDPDIYPYYIIENGDTVINNLTYHKIFKSNDTVIDFSGDSYTGCFREDSNKAVYFLPQDSINEVLMYDFSKQVGDTLEIPATQLWKYETLSLIIYKIDSVEIEGNFRKVTHFTEWPTNELCWIEGIGSNMGFLYSFYSYGIGEGPELNCFTHNDVFIYQNPESWLSNCFVFTEIKDQKYIELEMKIFPNPATTFITIQIKEGIPIEQVIIYNHLGQKVLEIKPVNNTVDVSKLKPGMYFLEVTTRESRAGTKLIID